MTRLQRQLIARGISTLSDVQNPKLRADLLAAAAQLLPEGEELTIQCQTTANCLREAEQCQLKFFSNVQTSQLLTTD